MKRSISKNEKLQAFALYVMATQHYEKAREFERGIARIFGDKEEFNDFVADAIYGHNPTTPETFDGVLKNAGIRVR